MAMANSQIIDELVKRPRNDIERDLSKVIAERERLQTEEGFLRTVLQLADLRDDAKPTPPSEPDDNAESEATKRGTARENILAVMRPRGFEPWSISSVIAAVQQRNPDAKAPAIRLALRRLEQDGILMRDQYKNYRLDPQRNSQLGNIGIRLV
jgi:hypothetical protein